MQGEREAWGTWQPPRGWACRKPSDWRSLEPDIRRAAGDKPQHRLEARSGDGLPFPWSWLLEGPDSGPSSSWAHQLSSGQSSSVHSRPGTPAPVLTMLLPPTSPGPQSSQTHPKSAGHLPAVVLQQAEPALQGLLQVGVRQPTLPAHGQQLQGQVWKGQIKVGQSAWARTGALRACPPMSPHPAHSRGSWVQSPREAPTHTLHSCWSP